MRAPRERRPTFSQAELQEKNVYEVGRLRSELQLAYMQRETLQSSLAAADRQNELTISYICRMGQIPGLETAVAKPLLMRTVPCGSIYILSRSMYERVG